MFGRKRHAVQTKHVNPLYVKKLEQIHLVAGSPLATPCDPDLL